MLKQSISLLLTLLALHVYGIGNVTISGYFPGAEGETIQLLTYKDLISKQPLHLTSSKIDESGHFELSVALNESRLLFLRIFNAKNYLYAAPGESYMIEYEQLVIRDPRQDEAALFRRRSFSFTVHGDTANDLHSKVMRLNDMVATYLEREVAGRVRASHRASLESFSKNLETVFADTDQPFFNNYLRYYLAYLERSLNVRGFNALFNIYVKDQPLLLNHPVYMDLFRSLFDNYVFSPGAGIRMDALEQAINKHGSYVKLMEVLENDNLLQDEVFRELVMLVSMDRMFSSPDFNNSMLLNILEETAQKSNVPEHRKIAKNVARKHQLSFLEGSSAADFILKDTNGTTYKLDHYKDTYVYLFFWAGWCPLSMQSMDAMLEIADRFSGKMELIGVLVDRDKTTVQHLLRDTSLPFPLLYFDNDYQMLNDFGITTVPFYILIGPGGIIQLHPFVPPHWGAQEALEEILGG